jgi:hypothetical protein
MYLLLSPNDCKELYPSNTPSDFIVELPQSITGTHISLIEVYYKAIQEFSQFHYVLCDLVESSVVGGKEVALLGTFFQRGTLNSPRELGLVTRYIKRIRIKVLNADFEASNNLDLVLFTIKVE